MPERNLQFEELSVHQALGIRHGDGFKIEELSGCINIIHGRNGSGKSTTARVIHELLWPGKTELERPSVSGFIREDERSWEIIVEPGHREWRLNGTVESGPELGPAEIRHRYRLSLEELVAGEDQDFAKEIADATQGGFDLEAAVNCTAFSKVPSARSTAAAAKEADNQWRAASDRQREIQSDERRRATLMRDAAAAKQAHELLPQLERVRDHRAAGLKFEESQARLQSFPEAIAKLQGNEREELDRLHADLAEAADSRQNAEGRIATAKAVQAETGHADGDAAGKICDRLKSRLPKLQRLESSLEQKRSESSQAKGEATELRQRLGKDFDENQIGNLSSAQFPELSDFARRSIAFISGRSVNEERSRTLQDSAATDLPKQSYEQLHAGIRSLREWLASPADPETKGATQLLPWILSLTIVTGLSIALGINHHPGWFAGLAAAIGLGIWEWWQQQSSTGGTAAATRAVHEADYQRSGLPVPEEWTADTVGDQLRQLTDLAVKRRTEDVRLRDLSQLQAQSDRLTKEGDELEHQRRELSDRLGPEMEMAEEWLPRFIENLTQWQQKCTSLSGHEQAIADLQQQQSELTRQLNADFAELGFAEIDSSEAASQSINVLDTQLARQREAIRDEAEARRELDRSGNEAGEAAAEREKILSRFGLSKDTEHQIDGWLAQRDDFLAARSALQNAEAIRNQRQADLAGFPPLDDTNIDSQIAEAQTLAGSWEALRDEITAIQVRIDDAKAGHELSDALDARERRQQELRDIQGRHLERAAGKRLAEWVRVKSSQGTRPQVFNRAKELLRQFTNNHLQLDMDDRSVPPKFIARRSETSADPVENLSVGERIQLLVAVRLAFIELNETIRLPLLLDEVLGTSDDERAAAIIDTVIAIAREGRQVFYFTAQLDEVGKWVTRLNETSTNHRVIDLDHVRDTTAMPARPIPATPVQMMPPPRPTGDDHAEYGRQLRISYFDPWDESSVRLHLWHVIDDSQLLYKMLRKQVTSWWQLKQLPEAEREKLFPGSATPFIRAKAAAQAIETAGKAWRVGRGRPVNREVLFNSKVISDRFLDDVVKLAEQVNGDADGIIEGMKNRLIPGWRSNKTHELQAYFSAHGFLPGNKPQTRTDIQRRVLAALSEELLQGHIERERVIQIVNTLPDVDD
jgi:energy-coupling factor transporter ATP-binding protein EcfA2